VIHYTAIYVLYVLLGLTNCARAGIALGPERSFSQDVYIWQRAWSDPLRDALRECSSSFSNLVVLAAEVSWKNGKKEIIRVALDYPALVGAKRSVGLALRIGPVPGELADERNISLLTSLAAAILKDAKANGLEVSELQIDYDCAESKLQDYRAFVRVLRKAVGPIPLIITALPSWMRQPAFPALVGSSDGYVLQVHSLERPKSLDAPFTLCDPAAAKAAVTKASSVGIPFRVALPTYGYLLAFATNGQFVGLSAEGPAKSWPADAKLREVRADPVSMAKLAQNWAVERPPNMTGIIWYRLPVNVDNFNWRWPTLRAIVASRLPHESVRAQSSRVEAGLVEISLVNHGELDISSRLAVQVRWQNARLVAGDGLRGFELVEEGSSTARFQTRTQPRRLPAGEQWTIGWLRFQRNVEVQLEVINMSEVSR